MKQNRKNTLLEKNLYFVCNTLLFSLLILYLFHNFFGIETITVLHIFTVFYAGAFFCGFRFFKSRGRILWGISLCLLTFLLLSFLGIHKTEFVFSSYINWLNSSGEWAEESLPVFQMLNLSGITAVVFSLQLLLERFFLLKTVLAAGIFFYLFFCMILKKEIPHLGAVLGIFYIVLTYAEGNVSAGKKEHEKKQRLTILWVLPFLVIYLFLICLLPSPKSPYSWEWARSFYHNAKEAFIVMTQKFGSFYGSEDFSISFTGFSEDGRFSGTIFDSDEETMTVTLESGLKSNIYLIGKVFDTFNGEEWTQTDFSSERARETDALETIYAVNRHTDLYQQDYLSSASLQVCYSYFNTEYLFAPLKSTKIQNKAKPLSLTELGDTFLFPKRKGYGTKYQIKYQQMNLDHPEFYAMLEEQQAYSYGQPDAKSESNRKLLYQLQINYLNRDAGDSYITEEDFQKRAEYIHKVYGHSEPLTPNVQAFLDEITADAHTDIEKLKAIEQALLQMTYTTSPGPTPKQADFLEYFLLEKKQGYCSYFATAFVLLARAEGIPARYLQGFCIPAGNARGEVTVSSSMAHAWPEAYLDGVGWIPFEPTPSYSPIRYTPWTLVQNSSADYHPAPEKSPVLSLSETEKSNKEIEEPTFAERNTQIWFLLLYALWFALFFILCFLFFDWWYSRKKYRKMNPAQKLSADVKNNMNVLSLIGYSLKEGETLSELRIRAQEGSKCFPLLLTFIQYYEEVLYGQKQITPSLLEEIRTERTQLLAVLKQMKGKKYPLYRIKLYFYKNRK